MSFPFLVFLLATCGLAASYVAWRFERIARTAWFRWGGVALFILLIGLALNSLREFSIPHLIAILGVSACWTVFTAIFIVNTIANLARSALSIDDLRVPPMFSLAEAALARRDYEEALRLLREVAAEHPNEPEPRRRLAEVYLALQRPDEAISELRAAEDLQPNPEEKMLLVFAIAETLADCKNDTPAAIHVIETFLKEHPNVRGRENAEARLSLLKERLRQTYRAPS